MTAARPSAGPRIDVVTVAYRSAAILRNAVEPLCREPAISVIVVDNDCPERSTSTLAALPVAVVALGRNAGFGVGCNVGAARGSGDAILFLNPDARIEPGELRVLVDSMLADPRCGAVGPHILETTGETQPSMRRAPRLGTAFGEALFLHRALRRSGWPTEIVRAGYEHPAEAEWLSGAVLCVRRSAFEEIGGFDERFFLYCEDVDLCTRLRAAGYVLRYEPAATAVHEGGASAPRPGQVALRATARIAYARKHARGPRYLAFRVAFALHELARVAPAFLRSRLHLRGRLAALGVVLSPGSRWVPER